MSTLAVHSAAQLRTHLKSLRKLRHMTQAELARRLGINQPRLAHIENHPELISTAQLFDLLAALGADIELRVKQPTVAAAKPPSRGEW